MGGMDKVFAPILGLPLIAHTVAAFEACTAVDDLVLVVAPGALEQAEALAREQGWRKLRAICLGGARRQDSVRTGLERLPPCQWVVVHDGARPCLEPALIERGLEAAESGAAVAAVPVADTIKVVSPEQMVLSTLDRSGLWAVQTPQVFRYQLLWEAHQRCQDTVTDDAAMVERLGHPVRVFPGSPSNLKVTTPEDLVMAEALLKLRQLNQPTTHAAVHPHRHRV